MNFAKIMLVCASLSVIVRSHTGGVLRGGHDAAGYIGTWPRRADEANTLQPAIPLDVMEDAAGELPRLRFDGTLRTVEEYKQHAFDRYLQIMKSQSEPSAFKDTQSRPRASRHIRRRPGMLMGSKGKDEGQEEEEAEVPRDPCLEGTPDFLCTVQLVPGGQRHIVSRKELEDNLREANETYSGFSLPFCCGGRASQMLLD